MARTRQYKKRTTKSKRPFNMRRRAYRKPATTYIKRTVTLMSTAGVDATPDFGSGLTFKLSDLPSYTEMTNLFDRFTIKKVDYRWYIEQDPNNQTVKKFPIVSWAHSFTTVTAPTALTDIQQYPSYRKVMFREDRPMTKLYSIRPAISQVNYLSGVSSGYVAKWNEFVNTSDSGTPFYGLKIWYDNLQTGVTLNLECTFHIQLRGIK